MVDGHEMPVGNPLPLGRVCLAQVDPPLVDTMATATLVVPLKYEPTAQQSEVEGHATAERPSTPLGALRTVQVTPPSVVVTIGSLPLPTATQSEVDGQVIAESEKTPLGSGC